MSAYVRLLLPPAGSWCDNMPNESWLCLLQDLCVMITDMQAMLQLIQQVQEGEKALQKELKEEQQRLLTDKRMEEMQKLSKEVGRLQGRLVASSEAEGQFGDAEAGGLSCRGAVKCTEDALHG